MRTKKEGAATTRTPNNSDLTTTSAASFKGNQMARVLKAFRAHPKTMLMVSIETGILRANICRYVAEWHKQQRITLKGFGLCKVSKHPAGYYQATPTLFDGHEED